MFGPAIWLLVLVAIIITGVAASRKRIEGAGITVDNVIHAKRSEEEAKKKIEEQNQVS